MRKKIFLSILLAVIFTVKSSASELKMMILSDVHIMAPELLEAEGAAFDEYLLHDRKLLMQSPALLKKATDEVLKQNPKIVLMPGDLTKDGEMLSHKYLKENCLEKLKDAGVKVLVIPGNHDINNPDAVVYKGDKKERTETMQASDFAEFYKDYGYGEAFDRDSSSLSYVVNLSDSLVLLALDANLYYLNEFEGKGLARVDGALKPQTVAFAEKHLKQAKKQNKRVIAMMHHGLIAHWKYQNAMMPGYLIDDYKKIARKFEKWGLEVIFTGHSHAQDISRLGKLYDVQTGSIVSFPTPYRMVSLKGNKMKINTVLLDNIDYDLGDKSLYELSGEVTREGVATFIESIFPGDMPLELKDKAVDLVSRYVTINYRGDEVLRAEHKAEIKALAREIRGYSLKWSIIFSRCSKALLDGGGEGDNDVVLELRKIK
ncbi:MAG: metallophosphoesterase [Rikenellaceae bacterium]